MNRRQILIVVGVLLALCLATFWGMVVGGGLVYTWTRDRNERDERPQVEVVPPGGLTIEKEAVVDVTGAVVVEVMPDSPAEQAGLRAGDVILAVDDQRLGEDENLADLIAGYEPGDRVTLVVMRPGQGEQEETVRLDPHPEDAERAYLGVRYSSALHLQMLERRGLPFDGMEEFDFDELPFFVPEGGVMQGALILDVTEDSAASAAGLKRGEVIVAVDGEAVDGPQALSELITAHKPGDRVTLTVHRSDTGEEQEVEVRLGNHPDNKGQAYLGVSVGRVSFDIQLPEDHQLPQGFEFHWDELPFDLHRLPFEPGELPHEFDFDFDFEGMPDEEGSL